MSRSLPDDRRILENFAAKVEVTDSCWLWKAALREKGYGAFSYYGRVICAHRAAWLMFVDDIPEGKCVLHHCDNAACVNPNHLWLGSREDNNVDMTAKGRHVSGGTHCGSTGKWVKGMTHHSAKLTDKEVRSIREQAAAGVSYSTLANQFHVVVAHIHRIVRFKARRTA